MKQHFSISIAFYVVRSFVQFFYDSLLLFDASYFVQLLGKIFLHTECIRRTWQMLLSHHAKSDGLPFTAEDVHAIIVQEATE